MSIRLATMGGRVMGRLIATITILLVLAGLVPAASGSPVGAATPALAVSTGAASNIGGSVARLNGNLTALPAGSTIYVWFEYGLSTAYGSKTAAQARKATGAFNAAVTGLKSGARYSFRAVASTVAPGATGPVPTATTVYGATTSFQTSGTTRASIGAMPPSGKIAFISNRDGDYEIFTMNLDASSPAQLTFNAAHESKPTWNPAGTKIAFSSERDGDSEIYTMNVDGSSQTRITTHARQDTAPAWSPDGTRIAWASSRDAIEGPETVNIQQVYAMDPDGSNIIRVTTGANTVFNGQPTWSPSGTRLAIMSDRAGNGNYDIWTVNPDGTGAVQLTNDPAHDMTPAWSPDGNKIAFVRYMTTNNEIFVMNADGTNQVRLTTDLDIDDSPAWTPDSQSIIFNSNRSGSTQLYVMLATGGAPTLVAQGSPGNNAQAAVTGTGSPPPPPAGGRIAFVSNRDGDPEIFTMNLDASSPAQLTFNAALDSKPTWNPDGTRIAYSSELNGDSEIFTMNADGSAQTPITSNTDQDTSPAWSPDGTRIAWASSRDTHTTTQQVYTMNPDGSNIIRVTTGVNTVFNGQPAWSPSGTRLAIMSDRAVAGTYNIWAVDPDGANPVRLTSTTNHDMTPAWSPDGNKIAFTSYRDNGNAEIYVMNAADGSVQTRLTNDPGTDEHPAWTPDSQSIIFTSDRGGSRQLYIVAATGGAASQVAPNSPGDNVHAAVTATGGPPPVTPPQVATLAATAVMQNSAQLNGNLSDKGTYSTVVVSFEWGLTDTYGSSVGTQTLNATAPFNFILGGLNPSTAYHYRAVADPDGPGALSPVYGADMVFTTTAPPPPPAGKIAFMSFRDGSTSEIYVMNPDGSSQTRLTTDSYFDFQPAFRPDGQTIAYVSERSGNYDIYVMDAAPGSPQTRLTTDAGRDEYPAWSPDGTKIAFASYRDGGNQHIWVMNADGTGPVKLTTMAGSNHSPAWSPDGTKIAFVNFSTSDIYVMNAADGSGLNQLTNNAIYDGDPAWKPDGTKIAYASQPAGLAWPEIWVMNADGNNKAPVAAPANVTGTEPCWSPDGSKIAFNGAVWGPTNWDIYVMDANGANLNRLTNADGRDEHPSWVGEPPPPPVVTGTATAITNNSATLGGTLNSLQGQGTLYVWFEYGFDTEYGFRTQPQSMNAPGTYTANLGDLPSGVIYHFRALASAESPPASRVSSARPAGTLPVYVGQDVEFNTTGPTSPAASTRAATEVTHNSARLNANLVTDGGNHSAMVYFQWGATTSYGNSTPLSGPMTVHGPFNAPVSGLTPNTTYHFRAVADADGAGPDAPTYGGDMVFVTGAAPTTIFVTVPNGGEVWAAGSSQNITWTSSGVTGNVKIEVSRDGGVTWNPIFADIANSGSQPWNVTGPATTQAKVQISSVASPSVSDTSDNWFSITEQQLTPPSVTTEPASAISQNGATLNGNLTAMGTATNVSLSFEYGPTTGYGTATTPLRTSAGTFNAPITGLNAGTLYNFRARAEASPHGSANGENRTFTTLPAQSSQGIIAFTSNRDGNWEIYTIWPDGTHETRLTTNTFEDTYPRLSVDGTKIAFASNRQDNMEIWVMNVDGTNPQRLTTATGSDTMPSWSYDGTKIVFTSEREGGMVQIWMMDANGANPVRVTNPNAHDFRPAFRPDGNKIIFDSGRLLGSHIWTADPNGANAEMTIQTIGTDFAPRYSPDGTKVVFESNQYSNNEIWVATMSGPLPITEPTKLTTALGSDSSPWWSPDGSKIVFSSERDTQKGQLYIMTASGGDQARLTNNTGTDMYPSWAGPAQQPPAPPAVATNDVSNIGTTTAMFNGNLTALGSATGVNVNFEWGTATGVYPNTAPATPINMTAIGEFHTDMSGLTASTTYFVRARAVGNGTAYGVEKSFTTLQTIPPARIDVNNGANINLAPSGTRIGIPLAIKNIPPQPGQDNGVGAFTFNLSWDKNVINVDSLTEVTPTGWYLSSGTPNNTTGTVAITGFANEGLPLTTDTVVANLAIRAVGAANTSTTITIAVQTLGDKDGQAIAYTTAGALVRIAPPPVVTTGDATNVSNTGATLGGNLTDLSGASSVNVSFQYGANTSYGTNTPVQPKTATSAFNADITGLTTGAFYHWRAKADGGAFGIGYGADKVFRAVTPARVDVNNGATTSVMVNSTSGNIPLSIKNIPPLGTGNGVYAFEFRLSWNKDVINVASFTEATVTGWNIFASAPNNTTGTANITGFTDQSPLTADTVLANLTVRAVGAAGASTTISVAVETLGDSLGQALPAVTVGGPVTIINMQAETAIGVARLQTTDDYNRMAAIDVKIMRGKHPTTGDTLAIPGGVGGYSATATPSAAGGIQFLAIRESAPYLGPTLNPTTGVFGVTNVASPANPDNSSVGKLVLRLTGDCLTPYNLTVSFSSITAATGGANVPEDSPKTMTFLRGNTNNDDSVNIFDAMFIARYIVGRVTENDINYLNAASIQHDNQPELNTDFGDKITIFDAMYIAQKIVGKRDKDFNWIG